MNYEPGTLHGAKNFKPNNMQDRRNVCQQEIQYRANNYMGNKHQQNQGTVIAN
jgi:hypothetical protein